MSDETKQCAMCLIQHPLERFNKRANGRCYAYCKACQSVYSRNHYLRNVEKANARRLESSRRYYIRNRTYAIEHLRSHPCVDCGESDLVVLEFDHIDPDRKTNNISDLIRRGSSLARMKMEIGYCEVRCIHCHRRRTAQQFGWAAV
jgi:hypothetical protein